MAQFEENSILREFLDVFQNGTPARLALFGVAQSEALLYIAIFQAQILIYFVNWILSTLFHRIVKTFLQSKIDYLEPPQLCQS